MKTGALASTHDVFVQVEGEKTQKSRFGQLQVLAAILAWLRHLVACNKVLNLLYWAMHVVLYRWTAAAIKMASLFSTFFNCHFVCCCPGGRWGLTEQVVSQWRCPVASRVALDMLHCALRFVSHRRTAMAIKTANNRGTCWCHCQFRHQQ